MSDRRQPARPAGPGRDDNGSGPMAAGLPGSIAAAWGLRERPGKGPKRGLSLPQIVQAGLAVARADGLGAVSMSRVAAELGGGTMSLYRYVESKQELLDLMVDTALGPPPPVRAGARWRDGLAAWARAELAVYRDHLWVLQVPLAGPPAYPNSLSWLEQALHYLRRTGLDEEQKMAVILLVSNYVRSHATMESQIDTAVRAAGTTGEAAMAGYGQLLRALLDPSRFPELSAVAASGVMDKNDPWDENFEFGLERVLDGVDVLVSRTSRQD
jgi:AcrR family transcriptional regulator